MPAEIVGAPPEYERSLREILEANPETLVEKFRFELLGSGLVLRLDEPRTAREAFEGRAIGFALFAQARARGARQRLTMIRWGDGDRDYLDQAPTSAFLREGKAAEEQALLAAVRRKAEQSGARVERLDVLRLPALAWALALHVDEPHAFLRRRLGALLDELEPYGRSVPADYVEVRDDQEEPAFVAARLSSGHWGMAGWSARADLRCCAPGMRTLGGGLETPPPPPPCPVFD